MRNVCFAAVLFFPLSALGATVDVTVGPGLSFTPQNVSVAPGDTVRWVFLDFHTSTSLPGSTETWDSGILSRGSFSHTFTRTGSNPYYCSLHPVMRGSVAVTAVAPMIATVDPLTATPGTVVTMTGTGFQTGAVVTFRGTASPAVTIVNSTTLHAVVPDIAAGAATIVITNPDTQSGSFTGFIVAPPAIPVLSRELLFLLAVTIAVAGSVISSRRAG